MRSMYVYHRVCVLFASCWSAYLPILHILQRYLVTAALIITTLGVPDTEVG